MTTARRSACILASAAATLVLVFAGPGVRPDVSAQPSVTPIKFAHAPHIANDGRIAFSYHEDIWVADADGSNARRLTAHVDNDSAPRFSPDGKWIAFTGQYAGADVYIVSPEGGTPERVTFLATGPQPVAWTPDGKRIVFRSGHENTFRPIVKLFTVTTTGRAPGTLFGLPASLIV